MALCHDCLDLYTVIGNRWHQRTESDTALKNKWKMLNKIFDFPENLIEFTFCSCSLANNNLPVTLRHR